mgnify:CR=1 FL=1
MAYVEVEVDMNQFADDELVDEIQNRGYSVNDAEFMEQNDKILSIIQTIWWKRRTNQDFTADLDNLIYESIGKLA